MGNNKNDRYSRKEIEPTEKSHISVSEAGRRGGYATLENLGLDHFQKIGRRGGKRTAHLYREMLSEFGKMGGRPKRPSLKESIKEENQ